MGIPAGFDVRGPRALGSRWPRGRALPAPQVVVHLGPGVGRIGPMARVELDRVEALELLGMVLAHLNDAEARHELSARVPILMSVRDKLAKSLQEDT